MKRSLYFPFLLFFCCLLGENNLLSQECFPFDETETLADMPEPVSNNAVCGGYAQGKRYIYSFGGIDTSKVYSGIHSKCWRYDIEADSWEALADLPDSINRIAASASYINGIIYIVGGYEVYPNGNELSVDLVHRFDCETNQFLSNATSLPTAIDDHVHGVWRDSLLIIVTGWSNTGNVAQVQLYNPTANEWESQSQIWNFSRYSSFGASGVIVADTIFYLGGAASSFGFQLQPVIRQGEIDPLDPLNIKWTDMDIDTSLSLYRGAALSIDGIPTWIGGSNNTYNYNGLAYDGSGGVIPSEKIIQYQSDALSSNECSTVNMDLRGIAWFPEHGELYISGGMGQNQEVSSQLVRLNISTLSADYLEYNDHLPKIFPNPNNGQCIIESARKFDLIVYDINGSEIEYIASIKRKKLNLANGIYILQISTDEKVHYRKLIVTK